MLHKPPHTPIHPLLHAHTPTCAAQVVENLQAVAGIGGAIVVGGALLIALLAFFCGGVAAR
jgi:hypothetical protein